MNKQLSLVMITLSWVAWLVAVFAFPIAVDTSVKELTYDSVSSVNGLSKHQFNISPDSLEIPTFKVDWTLHAKLNPAWYVDLFNIAGVYLSSSFFKKSLPLFDVKDTFIHFYYTW